MESWLAPPRRATRPEATFQHERGRLALPGPPPQWSSNPYRSWPLQQSKAPNAAGTAPSGTPLLSPSPGSDLLS